MYVYISTYVNIQLYITICQAEAGSGKPQMPGGRLDVGLPRELGLRRFSTAREGSAP